MYNKKDMSTWLTRILLFVILVSLQGCGWLAVRYINPDADFSYIKNVAVLPFNNLSNDRYAGEKIRSAMTVDLLSRHVFDVTEQGEVSKVMSQVLRATGAQEGMVMDLDRETLKLLGDRLGVQAVILGSVEAYSESRGGAGGLVTISARMLDTSSGVVLWQVRTSASGTSLWRKVVGIESKNTSTLTGMVAREALNTLL